MARQEPRRLWRVPDLTRRESDAADRLRGLDALTEHLSRDEADQFRAFLLGALAHSVSTADWENAMGNAMEFSNTWLRTTQGEARDRPSDPPD